MSVCIPCSLKRLCLHLRSAHRHNAHATFTFLRILSLTNTRGHTPHRHSPKRHATLPFLASFPVRKKSQIHSFKQCDTGGESAVTLVVQIKIIN